ncbi:MAG: ABC transporter ATP-binding protein [Erysipelothrix sp.]
MIRVDNIHKSYGEHIILEDLSFTIEPGSMVAIVGESGSGKTTLLNIIGGIESVDKGVVEVNGKNILKLKNRSLQKYLREEVSFLFQSYALMEDKTVYENISIVPPLDKKNESKKMAETVLETVGLKGYGNRIVASLSGGEQQRVSLARIMLKPSTIILADEPTGNLDSKNSEVVLNLFRKINQSGKTVIVVTHDKSLLNHFDKIIEL